MINRRGFIRALMAAPVAAALPWKAIAAFIEPAAPSITAEINLTLSEIVAETLRKRMPELIAQVSANNALLRRLSENRQGKGV